ncbi:hypothetical protein LINGRAHAP2_LOCUS13883 [Linum grandiflorum]
MKSWD